MTMVEIGAQYDSGILSIRASNKAITAATVVRAESKRESRFSPEAIPALAISSLPRSLAISTKSGYCIVRGETRVPVAFVPLDTRVILFPVPRGTRAPVGIGATDNEGSYLRPSSQGSWMEAMRAHRKCAIVLHDTPSGNSRSQFTEFTKYEENPWKSRNSHPIW